MLNKISFREAQRPVTIPNIRSLDSVVREAIAQDQIPGAVVDVACRGRTLVRKCFGYRVLVPHKRRMTASTLFDLASVTKVVATMPAAALLVEAGQLSLGTPVQEFFPGMRRGRKRAVTVAHLLTHTSGLPAYKNYLRQPMLSQIVADICALPLCHAPGAKFLYSDLGVILLGRIIEIASGQPLDVFCREAVFVPLGMRDTCFNPMPHLAKRCAATGPRGGKVLCGEVHDQNAFALGGVAGHAGLFSTVQDLRRFADMLLAEGWTPDHQFLRPGTVREFLRPRRLPDGNSRALGWDAATPYSSARGHLFPLGSVGHTGFTGTSIWLDPTSRASVILLTNRVHPNEQGDAKPLRAQVASIAAARVQTAGVHYTGRVEPGLDVWLRQGCPGLHGKRIGLVTNHTAIDKAGVHMLDHLLRRDSVRVVAIFSPEHGFEGKLDEKVSSSRHETTRTPIHSLYGEHLAPTREMLAGIDALVFDIQDVGTRFYTYAATMALCMRAAAAVGLPFVVLDRPNPINGVDMSGPLLRRARGTLTSYHRVPLRHGLTLGELALLANRKCRPRCQLEVVCAAGWRRGMFFDETGLPWVNPSPNMRNLKQAILYPAIGALEFSNLSVGRGTDTPFEVLGAPWIDATEFADALNRRRLSGLAFTPLWFEPAASRFAGQRCGGVYIMLDHRSHFRADVTALTIAQLLHSLYGRQYEINKIAGLLGSSQAVAAAKRGVPPESIVAEWRSGMVAFRDSVQEILLYS